MQPPLITGHAAAHPQPPITEHPNQPPLLPAWPIDTLALLALAGTPDDEANPPHRKPPPSTAQLRANLFTDITTDLRTAARGTTTTTTTTPPWDQLRSTIRQQRTAQLQQCKTDDLDPDSDSPTILHWLARKLRFEAVPEDDARFAVAQFVAEMAAELDPGLLAVQEREGGATAVHLFLGISGVGRQCVAGIVLGVCRAAARRGGGGKGGEGKGLVARALALRDGRGRNCLHLAVARELPDVGELVEMAAADAVLARREGGGNTPLHDAVGADMCALGVRECQYGSTSVMCSECEPAALLAERRRAWVVQTVTALIVKNRDVLTVKNEAGLPPLLYHKSRPGAGVDGGTGRPRAGPSANGDSSRHHRGGSGAMGSEEVGKGECRSIPTDSLAKDIEKYLVESTFDLDSFDRVCECFFGDNTDPDSQDQETVFRPERPLHILSGSDSYPFLNFGETLAQVDLSIDPNDNSELADLAESEPSLVEHYQTALVGVFEMLAARGVKRILKVSVRDNPKDPCSNRLIQQCLRGFEIRYLDWNSPDLRADAVVASAPRLVEIWLYSSGNDAVLREWVGSGGFCNFHHLHQLRMVHVRSQPGIEWTPRLLRDLDAFEKDLAANIEFYRYLKIASMEVVRVQEETAQLKVLYDSFNELLIFEAHRKKSIPAVYGPDTKPSRQHVEFLKQAQIPRFLETYRTRFDELRQVQIQGLLETYRTRLEESKRTLGKLRAFKQRLLQTKRDNVWPSDSASATESTGRAGGRQGGTPIEFSGLEGSGIEVSPFLAFRVDFVALACNVDTASIQPSVKSGRIKYDGPIEDYEAQSAKHRWLHSLRTFVSAHVLRSDRDARVRVAIIDDGVDGFHEDLRDKIKGGWPRESATSPWEPFYRSDHGHGTAMARLITAACPHVDLYVAKLKTLSKTISPEQVDSLLDGEQSSPDGSGSSSSNGGGWMSTAHEAALAIDWARRKGVHVVCMSWSTQAAAGEAAHTRLLNEKIQEAARDGIIMYCSASDQSLYGALKTVYPAAADTAGVRVVGAATERGHCSDLVNEDLVSYLFPGEEIDEIGCEKKGSSAATALAAGFAALVLWCFEVARPQSRAGMGSPRAMHYLFEGLQSLLAAKGQEGRRTKWVDASMLLGLGGIDEVVDFVEGEVRRRDPLILPKVESQSGQRLPDLPLRVKWSWE